MTDRDEIKEKIREMTDMVDVIGEFVPLKNRGRNYIGLCPFHDEKTPSFTVFPDRNIFKCFGCGKAGDIYTFLIDYHGMSFPEAIEMLAGKLGINLPKKSSKSSAQQIDRKDAAFKALRTASDFFIHSLNSATGKPAADYFKKRGFSNKIIKKFLLGYAPDSWDASSKELSKKGYSEKALEDAGLIVKKDQGGFYDRFRGRPIFPIRDTLGRIVGFGARSIKKDDKLGKYINSPQSLIYDKSQLLYGLFEGKSSIINKKEAILVEGYADVLTLHQEGFENTIASSGTAATKEQMKLLKKYCKKIYLVYDSDDAGIKAAEKAIGTALKQELEVFVVELPNKEDPDSIVRKQGKENFQSLLDNAKSFIDFKISLFKRSGAMDSPGGLALAAKELMQLIAMIPDNFTHDYYISHLTTVLKLNDTQLQKLYKFKNSAKNKSTIPQTRGTKDFNEIKVEAESIIGALLPEEIMLLNISLFDYNSLNLVFEKYNLSINNFVTKHGKRLFEIILNISEESTDLLDEIISSASVNEIDKQLFSKIALNPEQPSERWEKFGSEIPETDIDRIVRNTLSRLELINISNQIPELREKVEKEDSIDKKLDIIDQILELDKKAVILTQSLDSYNIQNK